VRRLTFARLSNRYLALRGWWGGQKRKLEQAMLALVIAYSKLLLLFLLIGTVVTLSRFESRKQSPLP
jgi:hypothetical protein